MNYFIHIRSTIKLFFEFYYWKIKKLTEQTLKNNHYKFFYTSYFSLSENFYKNKIILDIGCGPRGSLEWANMAIKRVGVDPLANKYLKMTGKNHQMMYIKGKAESLPFPDNYFDIISSFNSLDHVDNLCDSIREITRVLKNNGIFLLIVDIHHKPTITEPQTLSWDLIEKYFFDFQVVRKYNLKSIKRWKIYYNVRKRSITNNNSENGVLTAMLKINK